MTNNWAQTARTLTVAGLLTASSLFSWGGTPDDTTPATPANFPLSSTQEWYTEESYLLWKPYMENMWYGNTVTFQETSSDDVNSRVKVAKPDFDWSSGARVGIGRYLPNHDDWDVSFTTTFFYSDTKDETTANPDADIGFNSSFVPGSFGPAQEGSFNWRMNYWTVDLMFGRLFSMTEKVMFHPYFGLRGSFQYQHAKGDGRKIVANTNLGTQTTNMTNTLDNDFQGGGPRFGTQLMYCFENHFSFLANVSASLLVGTQRIKQNNTLDVAYTVSSGNNSTTINSKDTLRAIRSNIEGSVGLGYEAWMRNRTVRIAPSINFEGAVWFAMNQFYNIYSTASQTDNIAQRRQGNLGLMGVTFDLQVDF